jgi:leader peptidase (prepilin peptidase)/N-methyltransferase
LVSIFIIDFEHQIIPDDFIFFGLGFIFLVTLFINGNTLFSSLLSGFIAATFLFIIYLVTRGRGMGLGDVKFAVLGGVIVGLKFTFVWLFVAFLTGAAVGIILILSRKARLKDQIAFGPFLVAAIPITLLWGQKIVEIIGI